MTLEEIELREADMKDQLGNRRQIPVQLEVLDLVGNGQLSTQAFTLHCILLRRVMADTLTTTVSRKALTKEMHFMRTRALDIHLDALIGLGLLKARATLHGGFEYTLGLIPHPGRWD